jgi:hypothetical protein
MKLTAGLRRLTRLYLIPLTRETRMQEKQAKYTSGLILIKGIGF